LGNIEFSVTKTSRGFGTPARVSGAPPRRADRRGRRCVGGAWFDHQSFILSGSALREDRYFKALNKEIL
jgi:hypothetical protein